MLCVQYVICVSKERENRHLFPLLGYLHGYKIGQNFAYHLPPFILSPVLILPSVNQQQSVNVQDSNAGENYQENGGTFQIISPSRLTLSDITDAEYRDHVVDEAGHKKSSHIDIAGKPELSDKINLPNNDQDKFRQVITVDDNNDADTTTLKTITEIDNETVTTIVDITDSEVENVKVTTQSPGLYPTAVYSNENISNLSITTTSPLANSTSPTPDLQYNLTVPNVESNHNFSHKNSSNSSNENFNTNPPVTASSSFRGYSYANPWYNPVADKISITTSSYTNYEAPLPLAYDDRWQSFASLRKSYPTSDFRPLAGLYHDGFLHKRLFKKTGFVPVNSLT